MNKLITLLLITLLTIAVAATAGWVNISADSGIKCLAEDPNEPGPEFNNGSIDCLVEDTNEPGPEFIGGLINYLAEDTNEPGPECT